MNHQEDTKLGLQIVTYCTPWPEVIPKQTISHTTSMTTKCIYFIQIPATCMCVCAYICTHIHTHIHIYMLDEI